MKKQWCITTIDGEYIARMEDILDLYDCAESPGVARLCFDERPCQLLKDTVLPLPMKKQQPAKEDYEYIRNGTCVLLLAYDIDCGKRYLQVRAQRTKKDYAEFMYWVVSNYYPEVNKIRLVQDNLNTHKYGSFYERYPSKTAHWLKNKIDFHFTPKHASWLNMAEIEFSALARQAIGRRIESMDKMKQIIEAWQKDRNNRQVKIDWSFTTGAARVKMKKHYANILKN